MPFGNVDYSSLDRLRRELQAGIQGYEENSALKMQFAQQEAETGRLATLTNQAADVYKRTATEDPRKLNAELANVRSAATLYGGNQGKAWAGTLKDVSTIPTLQGVNTVQGAYGKQDLGMFGYAGGAITSMHNIGQTERTGLTPAEQAVNADRDASRGLATQREARLAQQSGEVSKGKTQVFNPSNGQWLFRVPQAGDIPQVRYNDYVKTRDELVVKDRAFEDLIAGRYNIGDAKNPVIVKPNSPEFADLRDRITQDRIELSKRLRSFEGTTGEMSKANAAPAGGEQPTGSQGLPAILPNETKTQYIERLKKDFGYTVTQ